MSSISIWTEETSHDSQHCHRRVVSLASAGELIHRFENDVDQLGSVSCVVFGGCPSQALHSPPLSEGIFCLNHPVRAGHDKVTGIELNGAFLIRPLRKHSHGCSAGLEPIYRAVWPQDYRRRMPSVDIPQ